MLRTELLVGKVRFHTAEDEPPEVEISTVLALLILMRNQVSANLGGLPVSTGAYGGYGMPSLGSYVAPSMPAMPAYGAPVARAAPVMGGSISAPVATSVSIPSGSISAPMSLPQSNMFSAMFFLTLSLT